MLNRSSPSVMSTCTHKIGTLEAALEFLSRISAKDLDDASDINNATACLFRIKGRHSVENNEESINPPLDDHDQSDSGLPPFRYASLPISQAAVEILANESGNEAMSLSDIVEAAKDGGYKFDGANPSQSAYAAFHRRANNKGDLIQVSRTHWGLRDWYTQRQIAQFRHSEMTKAGVSAARSRGRPTGGKGWAITADQAATIKARLDNGEKQAHVARDYHLTTNTIHRYKKLLKDWDPGDPFPPKPKQDDSPKLRAVE